MGRRFKFICPTRVQVELYHVRMRLSPQLSAPVCRTTTLIHTLVPSSARTCSEVPLTRRPVGDVDHVRDEISPEDGPDTPEATPIPEGTERKAGRQQPQRARRNDQHIHVEPAGQTLQLQQQLQPTSSLRYGNIWYYKKTQVRCTVLL